MKKIFLMLLTTFVVAGTAFAEDTPPRQIEYYLDTRRFGAAPHAGFGLGFERLMLFVTRMQNIRDVISFPRTPKTAEF